MRKIAVTGKHLCFFLLVFPLCWAEDNKNNVTKTNNDTVWSQVKTRRLFARQKACTPQDRHIPKQRRQQSGVLTPARRCSRLMETCSSHEPCCDPCASCHCRLFNTICHCWRMKPHCLKRM